MGDQEAIENVVLEASALGIALVRNRTFVWANRRLAEILTLPIEQIVGAPTRVIYVSDESYEDLGRAAYPTLSQGQRSDNTIELVRGDGTHIWCRYIGKALDPAAPHAGSVWMFDDITQQKQAERGREALEAQLRQAQKLEAVGQLAAGIAHEINTPMQYINDSVVFLHEAFADLLFLFDRSQEQGAVRSMPAGEEAESELAFLRSEMPKAFTRALDGIGRVTALVRAMKEFAHPDSKRKEPADLNRAIVSTLVIAKNEYKYVADVVTSLGDLPPVVCYVGEINQAMLNLIVNAAHAIGEVVEGTDRKGRITIETERVSDEIRIRVSDTGGGIPEGIRHLIFEPFFTTKPVGKGTGQGLAIARNVVQKHGGALEVESTEGVGTTFTIRLPINPILSPDEDVA